MGDDECSREGREQRWRWRYVSKGELGNKMQRVASCLDILKHFTYKHGHKRACCMSVVLVCAREWKRGRGVYVNKEAMRLSQIPGTN